MSSVSFDKATASSKLSDSTPSSCDAQTVQSSRYLFGQSVSGAAGIALLSEINDNGLTNALFRKGGDDDSVLRVSAYLSETRRTAAKINDQAWPIKETSELGYGHDKRTQGERVVKHAPDQPPYETSILPRKVKWGDDLMVFD